jgi:hypothetical protein
VNWYRKDLASTCKKLCPLDHLVFQFQDVGCGEEMGSQGNPQEDYKEQKEFQESQKT